MSAFASIAFDSLTGAPLLSGRFLKYVLSFRVFVSDLKVPDASTSLRTVGTITHTPLAP